MQVFPPGESFQLHLAAPMLLNQVPGHDYSTGEEVQQSIPVDAILGTVEAAEHGVIRMRVMAVIQIQEEVEIRYPPPAYFRTAVMALSNIAWAYPVELEAPAEG
jgi:hypothetical protein